MDPHTVTLQYSTSTNLGARIALHERYSTNPYGLTRWIFDRLHLTSGQRVLETACGTGNLWRTNRNRIPPGLSLVLSDRSRGMVETTRKAAGPASFVVCALPELPFMDECFDLAIANHVLYHVAQRERGLGEIRRVLRRGGTLFATTNGETHMRELKEVMQAFAIEGGDFSLPFTLENGEAQLRRVFPQVHREDYPDSLRVTEPELLIEYMASFSPSACHAVAAHRDALRAALESRIQRDGAFHITKSTGAFTASTD